MNLLLSHKQFCLLSTSRRALLIGISAGGRVGFAGRERARESDRVPGGVPGFFAWLWIFMGWLCGARGEDRPAAKVEIREPRIINRRHRREDRRDRRLGLGRHSSGSSEIAILFHLFGRGVSRTQFMEHMCRLSLYGRVRIFGIRSWGNVLVRRALLVCYDHGWWREPISEMGRVRHGVWHVHLWPEWKRLFLPKGFVRNNLHARGIFACARV